MHAIVFILTIFYAPVPAHDGLAAQPEIVKAYAEALPPNFTLEDCQRGGQVIMQKLADAKSVSYAEFGCAVVTNPRDQAA